MSRKTKTSKSKKNVQAVEAVESQESDANANVVADAADAAAVAAELGLSDDAEGFMAALEDETEAQEAEAQAAAQAEEDLLPVDTSAAEGSELEGFETAEVEDVLALSEEEICSVVESLLFSTDKPMTAHTMKAAFAGTKIRVADIRRAVDQLTIEYAGANRGVILEEVAGGYQLRTKPDNMKYLRQTMKARPFKLSGPALEVLSIMAYKQPCPKALVDDIRGVESGHLMRGLLERGLIRFGEKSDLPGRPMLYETSKKFLEIFGLRNLNELPSLSEIDQILPEGIDETDEKKESLSDLTGRLSETVGDSYSQGEEELEKITGELQNISTSSEFFEQEKQRQKEKREAERAQDIREKLLVGEEVNVRDRNWLERYDLAQLATAELAAPAAVEPAAEPVAEAPVSVEFSPEMPAEFIEVEASTEEVIAAAEPKTESEPTPEFGSEPEHSEGV